MKLNLDSKCKGTQILFEKSAALKRNLINEMIAYLSKYGYQEISIPVLQKQDSFASKIGKENNNLMYCFKDSGDRDLCLAPEYTSIIQQLSQTYFKFKKDVRMFYVGECFRGEKPQAGRYRQFTQFGVEIINPTRDYMDDLIEMASNLVGFFIGAEDLKVDGDATRGLDYYTGKGFEISCEKLGSSKQIVGGGSYQGGIGFAIGIDRVLCYEKQA